MMSSLPVLTRYLKVWNKLAKWLFSASFLYMTACTTVNVDHVKTESAFELNRGETLVLLGRRHSAEIETEHSLVDCVANRFENTIQGIQVISEKQFIDEFYPWFESRTAPLHPDKLKKVLAYPLINNKVQSLNIRYFVWLNGSTERTDSSGSLACSISPAGGGCFGFGTWEDTSDYEAVVWDLKSDKEVARVSTDAVGRSYLPAFIVPIPLLAGVERDACVGMGNQLVQFFSSQEK